MDFVAPLTGHVPDIWPWEKSVFSVQSKAGLILILTLSRRKWQPTLVLLPKKSQGWRSLVGYSSWGREESDMTELLHFHFSLSCIGEGNSNPLQCSCLENPRDGGDWWAAVYGVAQSWTRLKWLSSSSSILTLRDDYKDYTEHKKQQSSKLTQEEIEHWKRNRTLEQICKKEKHWIKN